MGNRGVAGNDQIELCQNRGRVGERTVILVHLRRPIDDREATTAYLLAPLTFLKADQCDSIDTRQGLEIRKGNRSPTVLGMVLVTLPGDADFEAVQFSDPVAPRVDEFRGCLEVGNIARNRIERGPHNAGHAEQRTGNVKGRHLRATKHKLFDSQVRMLENRNQGGLAFHKHTSALLAKERHVANEVEYVSHALLREQHDHASVEGRTVPDWLALRRNGRLFQLQTPLILGPSGLEVSHGQESDRQVDVAHDVIGLKFDRPAAASNTFLTPIPQHQDPTQVAMCPGVVRLNLESPPIAGLGLIEIARSPHGTSQLHLRQKEIGIALCGATEPDGSFIQTPLLLDVKSQSEQRIGHLRIEANGFKIGRLGLLELIHLSKQPGEIGMVDSRCRRQLNSMCDPLDARITPSLGGLDQTQQMMSVGTTRRGRENLLINPRCLFEPTGLMVRNGVVQNLGNWGSHGRARLLSLLRNRL